MQENKPQTGSAHVVIIVVLVIALLGALGFVFWNNFMKKDTPVVQTENKPVADKPCSDGQNVSAENGTFCSTEIGVKFVVPGIFANKLVKVGNYEVFQGPLDFNTKTSAGSSLNVYEATISGNDNFTFTIAQEPLRTGYVGVSHALQDTYYDQATGDLTLVNNTSTTKGTFSKGEVVPSTMIDGVRFFKGSIGDAGQRVDTYFGVINNKIVKISLKHAAYMGDPSHDPTTVDADKVFNEFSESMKALKIVKS